jgi:hypothetical protein
VPRHTLALTAAKYVLPLTLLLGFAAYGQAPAPTGAAARDLPPTPPPPLFFRETWKQGVAEGGGAETGEANVMQQNVSGDHLALDLIGPSSKEIQATGIPGNKGNPMHLWSGLCTSPCGAALRDTRNYVDLTGLASIKWNTKVSGLHRIHPIVKLADGTWLVGDQPSGSTVGWLENELAFASMKWLKLDPERAVTTGGWIEHPDLSKVDEVGYIDLMPGSGHGPGGWSDVAQIELYGKPVRR